MADVFLAVKGQLTNPSKATLRKAGVVVVEVDDLDQCRFVRASTLVSGDDMLYAAMKALQHAESYGNTGEKQREKFAVVMGELVSAAWADRQATS